VLTVEIDGLKPWFTGLLPPPETPNR
jgi:hypothetical protein